MVAPRFAPYTGGTEMHVAEVSRRLGSLGFSVEVLTTDPRGVLPAREELDGGVRVRRFRTVPPGGDHFFSPSLARHLRRARYDLVHVQGAHSALAPLAMLAARWARVPYVVTFHTGGHPSALRRRLRGAQWRALGPLLRRACALVAVSQFEQRLFADALSLPPDRIRLVPNGAELPIPEHVDERADLVLSVGRLEWYKGHHRAIDALPDLVRRRPDARLEILGEGPIRDALLARAATLGLADRVQIGSVSPGSRHELAERVAAAALVVLLSEYEAHPVAVAEALALNRRVLVADTSGLSEIAAAGHATAVPVDIAPADLAAAMDAALARPAPARAQALPGWDDTARAVASIYREAGCSAASAATTARGTA
jgi:glycosyltransferase involved in cell wall biosynthesis